MRVGIEIEYRLADTNGDLRPADEVIAACEGVDADEARRIRRRAADRLDRDVERLRAVTPPQRKFSPGGTPPESGDSRG